MPYTAELHDATISDYAPIMLHCIDLSSIGREHIHYATQPASEGRQVCAFPVERTGKGTGPTWYASGNAFYFATQEGAEQYISDRQDGVTRIRRDDATERWQGDSRLEDALA